MTRIELLKILVGQARENGFEFRRWYTTRLALPWESADAAFELLETHRRYYALLFSHEFAKSFWKAGAPLTFQVTPKSFERRMADGSIRTVQAQPYKRRTGRPDAWRYHLQQMAVADEPLRYIRRYLHIAEKTVPTKSPPEPPPQEQPPIPATLALARKANQQRKLKSIKGTEAAGRRGPRLPGARSQSA